MDFKRGFNKQDAIIGALQPTGCTHRSRGVWLKLMRLNTGKVLVCEKSGIDRFIFCAMRITAFTIDGGTLVGCKEYYAYFIENVTQVVG